MAPNDGNAALDPGFFEGRLLVEILSWDWTLHVGMSREVVPREYRFQGGLDYGRWFELKGRLAAPKSSRGKIIRVWLSPFGADMQFEVNSPDGVGRLYVHKPPRHGADLSSTLLLPESSIPSVATCLGTAWRYIHIWTFDEDDNEASVRSFSFSRDIHKNLESWVSGD